MVEQVWRESGWRREGGCLRIAARDPSRALSLQFADRLELPVRLRLPRSFGNPGAFDFPRYLEGEGIHLLGSVKSAQLIRRLPDPAPRSLWRALHRLRTRMRRRLDRAFPPEGEEARRYLEAILLGERAESEGRFETTLRRTGVYHILSISGLHFSLLISALLAGGRRLPGGRRWAPWVAGSAGLAYVFLAGAEDPILRTALAAGVLVSGRRSGRRVVAWDAQSWAAVALLAFRPLHLFSPGFQLSFVVTGGLLAGARFDRARRKGIRLLQETVAASVRAWLVSLPLLAASLLQVSLVALPLNLLAAPFLCATLGMGLLLLIDPAPWMGRPLMLAVSLFSRVGEIAVQIPGAFSRIPPPDPLSILVLSAALLALVAWPRPSRRRDARRLAGLLLSGVLVVATAPRTHFRAARLEFTALDVGQGDAVLLRFPGGESMLVDSGGFNGTDFDVGESVVVPALLCLEVRRLDVIVLTHAHQDHGGGLLAVMDALRPSEIWMGRMPANHSLVEEILRRARTISAAVVYPRRGSIRCLGTTCLETLHPPPGFRSGAGVSNEDSLVFRVAGSGTSLLLTGDVEGEGERLLLQGDGPLKADLLKIPHHGSNSSTSDSLLARVGPRIAVVSVGEGNPWGHPAPEVLGRLSRRGIAVYRTDRDGAVRLRWEAGSWIRK
jgi:competence protein ComEC